MGLSRVRVNEEDGIVPAWMMICFKSQTTWGRIVPNSSSIAKSSRRVLLGSGISKWLDATNSLDKSNRKTRSILRDGIVRRYFATFFFESDKRSALGFSGAVDSSLLKARILMSFRPAVVA